MIDELSIFETDKVIHTVETDMVKLVVEIECFGMSFDKFDKETRSSDGLQPKQADLSCVHAVKRCESGCQRILRIRLTLGAANLVKLAKLLIRLILGAVNSVKLAQTANLVDTWSCEFDVPAVYLQQFWKTVHKVPKTKNTIRFKLYTQEITYTVDMFRDTLKLLVETLDNSFVIPATIEIIKSFMNRVGYQGVVDKQKKNVIQYPQFIKLIIDDLMEKYPSIPRRHDEDYYSIKDDTPLEYETVFVGVDVPLNQPQPVVSTQGTHRITPKAHRTPTLTTATTEAQENVAKVQEKLAEEDIEKMVEGEEDEESYASEFVDSMLNDDVDDFGTRIEPVSYKENPDVVADDDVSKKKDDEKNEDDVNDDNVEKIDDAAEENDNDDHTDHTLIGTHATGNMETRNEQMQTLIPTPTRSHRKDLSSDKTISKELTATVSPTTATTSKTKSKK
ncbi:hypothetical protein Tco_0449435 [Tanacetum coccineum]